MPEPKSPAPLRIGGTSSFWGDSSVGASQLVERGLIDVLVFDYPAEATMAILAAAQRKNPEAGYATDFIDTAMRQTLPAMLRRGVKVVSNAGGINPAACARALQALAVELGRTLTIAVVEGDDVRPAPPRPAQPCPAGVRRHRAGNSSIAGFADGVPLNRAVDWPVAGPGCSPPDAGV